MNQGSFLGIVEGNQASRQEKGKEKEREKERDNGNLKLKAVD
jgi:hypothetical protein